MRSIGYQYLIEHFGLDVCSLLQMSIETEKSQKIVRAQGDLREIYYPRSRIRVADSWQDNLVFALKYEGVNLEVLKALFKGLAPSDIESFVRSAPLGTYSRRVWFLYEWLTNRRLNIEDLKTGNYVAVVDAELQFALPDHYAERLKRYKVLNNLVGTKEFCPLVRKTDEIRRLPAATLKGMADDLLRQYSPELIYRAVRYLFVKETKSSFEIERETPSQRRMDAFVSLLSRMSREPIDKTFLVELQNRIVDERYCQNNWRTDQVYVGETLAPGHEKVHFVAVKPEDVEPVMSAFLEVLKKWLMAEDADAIVLAAVMSFAFVFIHPFDDGNGRIHRYLMHSILARAGFTPAELIFPVSAVLLKRSADYDGMLETFSRRLMPRLDYEMDEQGEVLVKNDSVDYYRYVDFTPIVEVFQRIIQETIETEWKVELEYLREYDVIRNGMKDIVDLPEKKANQFIMFVLQNGGRLAARRRELFRELTDEEIARLEAVVEGLRSVQ